RTSSSPGLNPTHPTTLTESTTLSPLSPSTSVPDPTQPSSTHIIPPIQIKQEEVTEDIKPNVDDELCSLLKFDALWKEKFVAAKREDVNEDVEEEERGGGGSDSYDEWEEEEEEEEERMDVTQSEAKVQSGGNSTKTTPGGEEEEDNRTLEEMRQVMERERKERRKREEDEAVMSLNEVQIDWSDRSNQVEVRNAMQVLLDAVAHSNPEQFSLGKHEDKQYDQYVWPGTDKIPDNVKVTSKRVRSLLSLVEVDSDGLVPTPVRICHSCGRTCARFAPLLGCDYCPLHFHLDCLDPPLTSPPTLTWMCPTHPQHVLDRVLVREDCQGGGTGAAGLVERSEAWDAWANRPVNEDQVTREFLSKVRVEGSLLGSKRQSVRRSRLPARIPGFVSHHYRKPPELTPSLQEAIQVEAIKRQETQEADVLSGTSSTKLEREQFLRSLIALQTQLLLLSYENKPNAASSAPSSGELAIESKSEPLDSKSEDTKNQLEETSNKLESSTVERCSKAIASSVESEKSKQSQNSNEVRIKAEDRASCKENKRKSELTDNRIGHTELLSSSTKPSDPHISLETTPAMDVTESEVLGSKLDSYFRFGSDDFITPPTSNQAEGVPKMNDFKLDDINPNNFRVEDLFITTATSSLPVSNSTNREQEEGIVIETLDKSSFLDKSIEEEIVCLDDVKEEEEETEEVVKVKTEEKKTEEKEKEEDKRIEEEVRIKEEKEEDRKPEVKLKRSLFVQLNEMFHNAKLTENNTNSAIIDLTTVRSLDPALIQVLALEHLTHLSSHDTPSLLPHPHLSHPYGPFVPRDAKPPVRCHAQLCPVSRKLSPVPMTSNCLSIGLGPTATLDLSQYGRCSRVSSRHAVIFYEMTSNTYELVNLSEHGTRVDSISYELDPSQSSHTYRSFHYTSSSHVQRTKWRSLVSERIKQSPFLFDVKSQRLRIKEGMERRKKRRRRRADEEDSSDEEVIPLHYGETTYKCPCISDSEDSGSDTEEQCATSRKGEIKAPSTRKQSKAWESTCLVRHGSLLEFGCLKFVFSITEHHLATPPGRISVQ
ncbi:hypothetical protein WDU94_010140, partial [Cyamophila willieti]